MSKFNKIVRDKVPEIIQASKKTCDVSYVSDKEAVEFLTKRIIQEAKDFQDGYKKEELANLYEVLDAIMNKKGWRKSEIDRLRNEKNKNKGSFKNNIILKTVHSD